MTNVIINDILPRTQAIATGGQTVYATNPAWTANVASDVIVYSRPANTPANDATQILPYPSAYSVDFIGDQNTVQVTLVTPSTAGDVVTIVRATPADRENLYSNTNFTPSMLNNDFGILTMVDQQAQLFDTQIAPHYNYSDFINNNNTTDNILPVLSALQCWQKNAGNTAIIGLTLGTAATRNATNAADPYVASVFGSFTPGHFVTSVDGLGTIADGGYVPGTVSSVGTGTGLIGGTITTTGTISFAPITANSLWANVTGVSAVPTIIPTSTFLKSANNLNDVASISSAVANLGLTIGVYTQAWSHTLDLISAGTWPGASSITTLGTITSGIWHGTPIDVPHGGTGDTSFTAYSVICAGTSSTGSFQNVVGLGPDGYVLTSNGINALPSWQEGPIAVTPEEIQDQAYSFGIDTGIANAYAANLSPAALEYTQGMRVSILISNANSGASTISLNGLPTRPIVNGAGSALVSGQILAGMMADLEYDGTQFQLTNDFAINGFVNSGLINQLAYYAANGQVLSGLATGNNGVLITSAGGVPSISSTLPAAVQGNITALGTIATGVWNGSVIGLAYGGTNANLTAAAGGIPYSTASALALTAAGTSGQLFQSAGTSAPGWTTATYPATAGSSGNVLTSNGTNWVSSPPATSGTVTSVATNNGITGGTITSTGTIGLATIATLTGLVNTTGGTAIPTATTLTAWIDAALGSTQGNIIYRNASAWVVLAPGTNGEALISGGAGANVSWGPVAGSGTVTSVATNNGLTGGTITTTGTLGLATIATLTGLVNTTGGTAIPTATTLTAWIDAALGSTQGDILYRNSTVWTVLAPGTSGQLLQTKGAAANPAYTTATYAAPGTSGNVLTSDGTNWLSSAPATSGTVTSVATGIGLSGGTITSTGTIRQAVLTAASAYPSGATTLTANTYTKILFNTTEFNLGSAFDTSNHKFLPLVAGIYHVDAAFYIGNPVTAVDYIAVIYKNGSAYKLGNTQAANGTSNIILSVSGLVSMNGSTDYIEIFGYNGQAATTATTGTGQSTNYFDITFIGPSA